MKAYKLTDKKGQTKNNTQWGEGITHEVSGDNKILCNSSWIHFYTDPLIAVLMNSIHANFTNPILWECETSGEKLHEPLKSGCKKLTTIKQITLPNITLNQKSAFGILCSLQVYKEEKYTKWANDWLNGKDRSSSAANAAAYAANAAVNYADAAAHAAATNAAYAAASAAAYAAAYAANAANAAAYTASAAAYTANAYATASAAAYAAAYAAYTASAAAYAAAYAATIDFSSLAKQALTYS